MRTLSDICRAMGVPDDYDPGILANFVEKFDHYNNRLIGAQYQVNEGDTNFMEIAFECAATEDSHKGKFVIYFMFEDGVWENDHILKYRDGWRIDEDVYSDYALFKIKFNSKGDYFTNKMRLHKFLNSTLTRLNYNYQVLSLTTDHVEIWVKLDERGSFWNSAQEKMMSGSDVVLISEWRYDHNGELKSFHEFSM